MTPDALRSLLLDIQRGDASIEDALRQLRDLPYEDIGDARLDHHRHLRTGLPMSGPLLRRAILALCVDDEPYMIGADEAVRARSNRDLGHFLDPIFSGARTAPAARHQARPGPHG